MVVLCHFLLSWQLDLLVQLCCLWKISLSHRREEGLQKKFLPMAKVKGHLSCQDYTHLFLGRTKRHHIMRYHLIHCVCQCNVHMGTLANLRPGAALPSTFTRACSTTRFHELPSKDGKAGRAVQPLGIQVHGAATKTMAIRSFSFDQGETTARADV